MDYATIYLSFIADRRTKEGALRASREYRERHHIVPKSLGGKDDSSNLIDLTPEDHYFAHLLLAQVHGGTAWTTVKVMCHGWSKSKAQWRTNRPMYGVARRIVAEQGRMNMLRLFAAGKLDHMLRKGTQNNKFNHEVFEWVNLDTKDTRAATLHAMHQEFGGSRPSWTTAVTGGRKSMLGWALGSTEIRIRGLKGKVFLFVNRDGSSFTGTQGEFCKHAGLSAASGTRVCRNESVTRCGWRLDGVTDRPHSAQKSDGSSARLNSGNEYRFTHGSLTRKGKISDLAIAFGSTKQQLHAAIWQINNGNVKGYKGWELG